MVCRERHKALSPILTSQKKTDTMLAMATAMISKNLPLRWRRGRGGRIELDRYHRETEKGPRRRLPMQSLIHTHLPAILSSAVYRPQTNLLLLSQKHTPTHTLSLTHTVREIRLCFRHVHAQARLAFHP